MLGTNLANELRLVTNIHFTFAPVGWLLFCSGVVPLSLSLTGVKAPPIPEVDSICIGKLKIH